MKVDPTITKALLTAFKELFQMVFALAIILFLAAGLNCASQKYLGISILPQFLTICTFND
jgi:hypothetical protein